METTEINKPFVKCDPAKKVNIPSTKEELLRPWKRASIKGALTVLLVVLLYWWGILGTQADIQELIEGIPNIINFFIRLFPPMYTLQTIKLTLPFSMAGEVSIQLPEIVFAIIETIQMAIIGSSLSVFLSMPFGLLAARNTSPHPSIYQTTRFVLNMIRAVPEIIFALIFVSAVGLGPFSGVLALAIGSIGFLGKLYAESIEAIDPQQVLAVRATGSHPLQIFRYGVAPQALPLVASYSLYVFEHNVRSASILGLVGAGGVGFVITKYIALFQFRHLLGALILIILMVTIVDRISDRLRKMLI